MKMTTAIFMVMGCLLLLIAGGSGLVIAGIEHASPGERAIAMLATAVAGLGLVNAGAMFERSS